MSKIVKSLGTFLDTSHLTTQKKAKKTPHAEMAIPARGDGHRRTRGLKRRLRGQKTQPSENALEGLCFLMFCPLFFYISFFQISLLLCHDGQDGCHVGNIYCIIVIDPVLRVVHAVCHSCQHSCHVGNIDSAIKVYIASCGFGYQYPFVGDKLVIIHDAYVWDKCGT